MKTPPPVDRETTISLFLNEPSLLERLLDNATDAFFVVTAERKIAFWNRRAEELTGYSAAEVLGRTCISGIHCDSCRDECRLFERGDLRDLPVVLKSKAGDAITCTKNAFVLRDSDGQPIAGVEFLKDETALLHQIDQGNRQRAVIEANERLNKAILRSIKEGVISIDRELRVTSFSARAEEITGRRADWAIGRYCHEVIGSNVCNSDCPARGCFAAMSEELERAVEIQTAEGVPKQLITVTTPLRAGSGEILGAVIVLEDRSLLAAMDTGLGCCGIIGASRPMHRVFQTIRQVAPTEATCLIQGESGTGKELLARAIHLRSRRKEGPFFAINCAALPDALLESELFGHVKGSFTGAIHDRVGAVEAASGGTLFLDEIGDMPLGLQAKLLRFLQDHTYQPVGDCGERTADVRIIAATNRDLEQEIKLGRFREDLFYRIRVIPITLPPLRERGHDVALIAVNILPSIAERVGRPGLTLTPGCIEQLSRYAWPGNVRELINALEYSATLAPGHRIRAVDLPAEVRNQSHRYSHDPVQGGNEASLIEDVLQIADGNKTRAASILGMNRVTLYRKLQRYGLQS